MYKITSDVSYLSNAEAIANAATGTLVNNGILKESCEPSSCGGDGPQFKGIFMRNLGYLYSTSSITTHPISARTARYVKLNITNPQSDLNIIAARIYELEVYAS